MHEQIESHGSGSPSNCASNSGSEGTATRSEGTGSESTTSGTTTAAKVPPAAIELPFQPRSIRSGSLIDEACGDDMR